MAHLYMAVPPQGSSPTAHVETGVYLRMGTYADEKAYAVDEYTYMPKGFKDLATGVTPAATSTTPVLGADASGSEGIFITSSGTYIVTALDEGHIEVHEDVTLDITGDGAMTTTVKNGNVEMTLEEGAFHLTGNSHFDVTSKKGNIGIAAKEGKVSTKGNYVYTHTYGSYIKIANANKTSGTIGADTNVSLALNMSFYGSVLFSAKLLTISVKLYSTAVTLFQMTVNVIAFDFNNSARAYLAEDIKFAYIYIKYRGVQLESPKAKTKFEANEMRFGLAKLNKGLAKADTNILKAAFGLRSHLPPAGA